MRNEPNQARPTTKADPPPRTRQPAHLPNQSALWRRLYLAPGYSTFATYVQQRALSGLSRTSEIQKDWCKQVSAEDMSRAHSEMDLLAHMLRLEAELAQMKARQAQAQKTLDAILEQVMHLIARMVSE